MPVLTAEQQAKRPRRPWPWVLALAVVLLLSMVGGGAVWALALRSDGLSLGRWTLALELKPPGFTLKHLVSAGPLKTYHIYSYQQGHGYWEYFLSDVAPMGSGPVF